MGLEIQSFRELRVYQAAFALQQAVFIVSKRWPREENHSLIDQIRRSSRSIGANISEAWARRRYVSHFVSKLTDADGELQETEHWVTTALACECLTLAEHDHLHRELRRIGEGLGKMLASPEKFLPRNLRRTN